MLLQKAYFKYYILNSRKIRLYANLTFGDLKLLCPFCSLLSLLPTDFCRELSHNRGQHTRNSISPTLLKQDCSLLWSLSCLGVCGVQRSRSRTCRTCLPLFLVSQMSRGEYFALWESEIDYNYDDLVTYHSNLIPFQSKRNVKQLRFHIFKTYILVKNITLIC